MPEESPTFEAVIDNQVTSQQFERLLVYHHNFSFSGMHGFARVKSLHHSHKIEKVNIIGLTCHFSTG